MTAAFGKMTEVSVNNKLSGVKNIFLQWLCLALHKNKITACNIAFVLDNVHLPFPTDPGCFLCP